MLDETNIRNWYTQTYPTDACGIEINKTVTFRKAIKCLFDHNDFYALIGVADSLVRERVFAKLAELYNKPYEEIHDLWCE